MLKSATRSLSPRSAKDTDHVPCLTGNPRLSQPKTGTIELYQAVNLYDVLYEDGEEEDFINNYDTLGGGASRPPRALEAFSLDNSLNLSHNDSSSPLPEHRNRYLALLSVPLHMLPQDLLHFVSPFREEIRLMRIVSHCFPGAGRGGASNMRATAAMVLLEMNSQVAADNLYSQFNDRPFNSLEPATCRLAYIRGLSFEGSAGTPMGGHSLAAQDHHDLNLLADIAATVSDLPSCPVCLESLTHDSEAGATAGQVLVTACNHGFHIDCLRKWDGSLCPVCRYNHDSLSYIMSTCSECGRPTDVWVCLICGNVGCGRYGSQHSRKHYNETLHAYAVEVQTQQVWDFVGDGYVHRLIYNKGDGKMVEVADPSTRSDQRPQTAPPSDTAEEEMVHRKLESFAVQYSTVLSSLLEKQRRFYEEKLRAVQLSRKRMTGAQVVAALKQEKKQLEHRCVSTRDRLHKVTEEMGFLLELNKSLEADKKLWEKHLETAERELQDCQESRQAGVAARQQRVCDLMMKLDGGGAKSSPVKVSDEQIDPSAPHDQEEGEEAAGVHTPRKGSVDPLDVSEGGASECKLGRTEEDDTALASGGNGGGSSAKKKAKKKKGKV